MFVLHWDQTKCPVYKRCPDFRVSTFRGSTVFCVNIHSSVGILGGLAATKLAYQDYLGPVLPSISSYNSPVLHSDHNVEPSQQALQKNKS